MSIISAILVMLMFFAECAHHKKELKELKELNNGRTEQRTSLPEHR